MARPVRERATARWSASSPGSHACSSSCPRRRDGSDGATASAAVAHAGPADTAPRRRTTDPAAAPALDAELLGGVAAAMALVKAHRMHGHLAAQLDPLGSEPIGDPALDPLRLEPKLTPELQARIPAVGAARPRRRATRSPRRCRS